jgi:hypothetical protein
MAGVDAAGLGNHVLYSSILPVWILYQSFFQILVSRGEQNRKVLVVSKTGIPVAAPSVFEEGERSDARRKD